MENHSTINNAIKTMTTLGHMGVVDYESAIYWLIRLYLVYRKGLLKAQIMSDEEVKSISKDYYDIDFLINPNEFKKNSFLNKMYQVSKMRKVRKVKIDSLEMESLREKYDIRHEDVLCLYLKIIDVMGINVNIPNKKEFGIGAALTVHLFYSFELSEMQKSHLHFLESWDVKMIEDYLKVS